MRMLRRIVVTVLATAIVATMLAAPSVVASEEDYDVKIYDMLVDDLVAPVGLDNTAPRFSWKMASAEVGQKQTAYCISVKKDGSEVWNTGKVESGISVGIVYEGPALQSSTEYTWKVTVWDKDGQQVESQEETFEMGLLGADAFTGEEWISGEHPMNKLTAYSIDFDFVIHKTTQNLCIGVRDESNFIMLRVQASDGTVHPYIREHSSFTDYPGKSGSTMKAIDASAALGATGNDLLGKTIHERIVVNGRDIEFWFGENEDSLQYAGTYTHTKDVTLWKIAARNTGSHSASYDNLVVKNAQGQIVYQEDFSDTQKSGFGLPEAVNGMLKVTGDQFLIVVNGNAPGFRKRIETKVDLVSAKLYTSGLGVYESYINGNRVGHLNDDGTVRYEELKPGFTEMGDRKYYSSYDVTWMMDAGAENVLSAVVTSGWWSGEVVKEYMGDEVAYLAKLILTYADGTQQIITTDETWKVENASPIQYTTGIYAGERYDARVSLDWMLPGFDDSQWRNAYRNTEFTGEICAWNGVPVQVRPELEHTPKTIKVHKGATGATSTAYGVVNVIGTYQDGDTITLEPGQTLFVDFGQNFAGWEALEIEGAEGTIVKVEHGEWLNDSNGEESRGNDGPGGSIFNSNYRTASANTVYIMSGKGIESYHPSQTYYGFQYLEMTASATITVHKIRGQVVTSAHKDTGTLETSDASVNQLISNIRWGMYSNYLSVPTDCPQRNERMAWTGDTQLFAHAGSYLNFSKSLLMKFMQDMRDTQNEEGAYPDTAPITRPYGSTSYDEVGWSDAGIIVPYTLYMMYGDTAVIEENWDSMSKYMRHLQDIGMEGSAQGAGEHLSYELNNSTTKKMLSVYYYIWDAQMMGKMAAAIGETEAVAAYKEMEEAGKAYFQGKYLTASGELVQNEQTLCLYALFLDVLPNEASVEAVTAQLVNNISSHGNMMQTGFLGTGIISKTLTKIGRSDLAYKLLLQHGEPSWLYSVDQGATTVWERWNTYTVSNGFHQSNMNSFNHYSYGAVAAWMFQDMAGIGYDPENPGFKNIIIAPHADWSLPEVSASYDSAYGMIKASSVLENGTWTYNAVLPANTTATVKIPVEKLDTLKVNTKAPNALNMETDGIVYVGYEDGVAYFDAVAGNFTFVCAVTEPDPGHAHCWCVNAEKVDENHKCNSKMVWEPIAANRGTRTVLQNGKAYYLDWNGVKEGSAQSLVVEENATAYLCLNGSLIFAQSVITLNAGSSIVICDCSEEQTGIISTTLNAPIIMTGGNSVRLMSGTIDGTKGNTYVRCVEMTGGNFYMYGGKLTEGESTANGGNVLLGANSIFTMYGGEISKGKAGTYGGNIALTSRTARLYINGGKIFDGDAGTHGGNICISYGTGEITAGAVTNGEAAASKYGADISVVNDGSLSITGGTVSGGALDNGKPSSIHFDGKNATVGGAPQLQQWRLASGKLLTIRNDLDSEKASVGISLVSGTGAFTAQNGATAAQAAAFTSDTYDVCFDPNAGKLTLGTALAQVDGVNYVATAHAVQAANGQSVVKLLAEVTDVDAGTKDLYLDLNGHNVTGTVTAGTVYGIDTTTNGYIDDACGYIANVNGTVASSCTTGSGTALKRYLKVENADGISFHRIYVAVTAASITPQSTGLNYKTAFIADKTVMNYINDNENVVFGLKAQIPGYESVYAVDADGFEAFEGTQDIKLYTERRTAIANVLKTDAPTGAGQLTNMQRAELEVTAQAVVAIDNGDGTYTDLVISSGANSTASFRQMAEKADTAWPSQSYAVKKALYDMYTAFKTDIDAAGWNVTNMKTDPKEAIA